FLLAFFAYLGIWVLFDRFGNIRGWSLAEVSLCFGVTVTAFSLTECLARGFDLFSQMIVRGDFDRVMLRPRATIVQVLGSSMELSKVGRFAQSLLVLGLAISWMPDITPLKVGIVVLMVISGVFVFTGLFILGASVCFYTVQGLEVINVFTDGGRELASYPVDIYGRGVARFFTFVIPFGCFNYLPLLYITGRASGFAPMYALAPLIGMLFIVPCILVWNHGAKHYLSTGS
ncbi:ABC-2 family transporter protein, partial [Eubacteriales bacterium OttesenSCG-928-N13]|nr:ABC-2 family transporter protein [Eubacteriales bacterium OttesenSCG-928-N13]